MPAKVSKLGPGSLSIGEVGTEVDFSCQVEFAQVTWDKSKDDDVTVLCGDVVPGAITYTAKLKGKLFQDQSDAAGIVQFSWANKGTVVPFIFVPNDTDAVEVTGEVTMDPISVGSDTANANMKSDFEWDCVGEPELGTAVVADTEDDEAA